MGTLEPADAAATLLGDDPLTGDQRLALAQLLIACEPAPGTRAHEALTAAVAALTGDGPR